MKSVKTALEVRNSIILGQASTCHFFTRIYFKDVSSLFACILFKVISHQDLQLFTWTVLYRFFSNTS